MKVEELKFYARQLLENPLFNEACAEFEANAINDGAFAKYDDHEKRLNAMAEVRAIRNFRDHCKAKASNTDAEITDA